MTCVVVFQKLHLTYLERRVQGFGDVHLEGDGEHAREGHRVRPQHDVADLGQVSLRVTTVLKHIVCQLWGLFLSIDGKNLFESYLE